MITAIVLAVTSALPATAQAATQLVVLDWNIRGRAPT